MTTNYPGYHRRRINADIRQAIAVKLAEHHRQAHQATLALTKIAAALAANPLPDPKTRFNVAKVREWLLGE